MIGEFCSGVNCFFLGMQEFFRTKKLWKYSIIPLLLTFLSYILLFILLFLGAEALRGIMEKGISGLPTWCAFLKYLYTLFHFLFFILTGIAIFYFTLPMLSEIFHGLFSDSLLEKREEIKGRIFPARSFRENLHFILENIRFNFQTFLAFLLLFPLSLCIPIAGGAALWIFLAFRMGSSLILPAGFLHEKRAEETLKKVNQHKMLTAGFGIAASFTLFFPLLFPLFLPAMTIGGAILYERMEEEEKEEK